MSPLGRRRENTRAGQCGSGRADHTRSGRQRSAAVTGAMGRWGDGRAGIVVHDPAITKQDRNRVATHWTGTGIAEVARGDAIGVSMQSEWTEGGGR